MFDAPVLASVCGFCAPKGQRVQRRRPDGGPELTRWRAGTDPIAGRNWTRWRAGASQGETSG